jgi:hypothetical protein
LSAYGHAEDGVSKDSILFGQVAALNGPAQALGQGMREGILAAFEEANRAGGINGRRLELKSIDDSYEPEKTIEANEQGNQGRQVSRWWALGTRHQRPASRSRQPPRCPSSGLSRARNPPQSVQPPWSIFAPHTLSETEAWIEHLTNDLGVSQNRYPARTTIRSFRLAGVKKAMEKAKPVAGR